MSSNKRSKASSSSTRPPPAKKRKTAVKAPSPAYYLYYIGGFNTSGRDWTLEETVSRLNVKTKQWEKMSPMPNPRSCSASAVIGEKIYIFGGLIDKNVSDVAQEFDTKLNQWKELASMPVAKQSCAAVSHNGFIYLSGGYAEDYKNPSGAVDRYCVATNEWKSVAPMLTPRYGHMMTVLNDTIYAFGGSIEDKGHVLEKYDPVGDKWEAVDLSDHRGLERSHGIAVYKNKFCMLKGSKLVLYDPATDKVKNLKFSLPRHSWKAGQYASLFDYSTVTFGDKMWDIDGYDNFYEYEPSTGRWKRFDPDWDIPRNDFQVIPIQQ